MMTEALGVPVSGPVLACDLGGTVAKLAVVADGSVLTRSEMPSRSDEGLAPRLPELATTLAKTANTAGMSVDDCAGISIALPGIIDPSGSGVLSINGKFIDAPEIDLIEWAEQRLGLPAVIENDARAAAIGEWHHGAGRGHDDFVTVTLGTGIGVSAVCGGRVLRGPHGGAGILGGHLTMVMGGRACSCGRFGCAEAEASTAALQDMVADLGEPLSTELLDSGPPDYAKVFELADRGDAVATELKRRSLDVWSTLVVDLVHAYDPECVVLGGGVSRAEGLVSSVARALCTDPWSSTWGVDIVLSELGPDAALVAAPWLLAERRARLHDSGPS